MNFQWRSDFIGPTSGNLLLHVNVTADADGLQNITSSSLTVNQLSGTVPFFTSKTVQWAAGNGAQVEGSPAFVRFVLDDVGTGSGGIDTGTTQMVWANSGQGVVAQTYTGTSGGLTAEQATQLQETHEASFPSQLVDQLTLLPLTSGPTGDFVAAQLPNPTFGVIVRIANVPEELVPNTPDGDYWFTSLAVVRVFRGADLWKRVPIHTSSKLVELLDESIVAGITAITATQWLLNMTVQVTFRAGVTGEVFLMKVP
jgi:hypothetical protein